MPLKSSFTGKKGDASKLKVDENEPKSHTWIIVTNPIGKHNKVIILNFASYRKYSVFEADITTLLGVGDHSTITHPTYINYYCAKIVKLKKLLKCVNDRTPLEPISEGLVERVERGIISSPHTPQKIKYFFQNHFDVE